MQIPFAAELSPASYEGASLRHGHAEFPSSSRVLALIEQGLVLDLGAVKFAEFAVLARILVEVDWATRHGIRTRVVLPREHQSTSAVRRFLYNTGFLDALTGLPGDRPASVTIAGGPVPHANSRRGIEPVADRRSLDDGSMRILPFRWVKPGEGAELRTRDDFSRMMSGLERLGLRPRDADEMANTIVFELIENVHQHAPEDGAPAPFALFGAILLGRNYKIRRSAFSTAAQPTWKRFRSEQDQLLRICLGDSGAGLAATIRRVHSAPEPEAIIFAFDKFSTSRESERLVDRGTRGLWHVDRVVRRYGGAALVRTGNAEAGYGHLLLEEEALENRVPMAWSPGTFLDVSVLPLVPLRHQAARRPDSRAARNPPTALPELIRLRPTNEGELSTADERHLQPIVTANRAEHTLCVIALGRENQAGAWHDDRVNRVVYYLSRLANPTALALVAAELPTEQVVQLRERLDLSGAKPGTVAGDIASAEAFTDPVLLVSAQRHGVFLGGDWRLVDSLNYLIDHASASIAEVAAATMTDPTELRRLLNDQPHLLRFLEEREEVELRLTPFTALEHLADQLASELKAFVTQGADGLVSVGSFVAPTLERTSRWIDVAAVAKKVGSHLLGLALAHRIGPTEARAVVVLDEAVELVGEHLAMSIGATAVVRAPSEADRWDTWLQGLQPGSSVVIVAGVFHSENALRRVVADLADRAIRVMSAAALYDCRADGRDLVSTPFGDIEIVAVTSVDVRIAEGDAADLTYIDPVLLQPTIGEWRPNDRYPLKPEDFAALASRSDSIRHGHLARGEVAHFALQSNVELVLDDRRRGGVRAHLRQAVYDWLAAVPDAAPVSVLHPDDRTAERLAKIVVEIARRPKQRPTRQSVRRRSVERRWAYPAALAGPLHGHDVIIADWGAVELLSIEQLVRLAVTGGSRRVLTLTLISQLAPEDENFIGVVRSARRSTEVVTAGQQPLFPGTGADVTARFITRFAGGRFDPSTCPMCELRQRYERHRELSPTKYLESHYSHAAADLAPTSRAVAFQSVTTDAFGVPAFAEELRPVADTRRQLHDGLRSVRAREQFLNFVQGLGPEHADARAVIRVLALERQWLKLPPVRLGLVREEIVRLAAGIAVLRGEPPGVVRQAIEVLGAIDPAAFLRVAIDVLDGHEAEEVHAWVLAEVHRMALASPRADVPTGALERLATEIRDRADARPELSRSAEAVGGLARRLRATRPSEQALLALRETYTNLKPHAEVVEAAVTLTDALEVPSNWDERRSDSTHQIVLRTWSVVQEFLEVEVLPNLLLLPWIDRGGQRFDRSRRFRERASNWKRLEAYVQLSRIEDRLTALGTDEAAVEERFDLLDEIKWWIEAFVSTSPPGERGRVRSWLSRVVEDFPPVGVEVVKDAVADARQRRDGFTDNSADLFDRTLVSCSSQVLTHALGLCIKNAVSTHRQSPEVNVHLEFEIAATEEHWCLTLRNTGSRDDAGERSGLRIVEAALGSYGGRVEVVEPTSSWTYIVKLVVPLLTIEEFE